MEASEQWLIPFVVSNVVLGLMVIGPLKRPMWTRIFLAGFFLGASIFNSNSSLKSAEFYLIYGLNALPLYSDFINGFFSHYITPFVLSIAIGQFLIFIGLVLHKIFTKLACIGGIFFGVAIAPLGVGSAFPATVFTAIGFYILLRKYEHDYIWKWKQYTHQLIMKRAGLEMNTRTKQMIKTAS